MTFGRIILFIALATAFSTGGCAHHENMILPGQEVDLQGTTFSFDRDSYPSPMNLFSDYKISPGDVLDVLFQIETWRKRDDFPIAIDHTVSVKFVNSPELNETQAVKPDGRISLPYIGDIEVVNKTVSQLTEELKALYAKILRDPVIYITIPEFNARIKELKQDLHTAPRGLSRLVTVRPDGYVTFPLVGDVFVAGRTFPEIKGQLDDMYNKYMVGLHVDLFLEKHSGSVIYVVGEVSNSGMFSILKPVTVLQAIALAGGPKYSADLSQTIIFRNHEKKTVAREIDLRSTLLLEESREFFYLRPDDIVYLPKTGIASQADIMRDVADIIFFRGWSISVGVDTTLRRDPIFR